MARLSNSSVVKRAWADVKLEQLNPLLSRRMLAGQRLMLAQMVLKRGCVVPRHSHMNEQLSYILEGALRFWVGENVDSQDEAESIVLRRGEVLTIPSDVPHRAVALEDTQVLDAFSPPRRDWLAGADSYLRVGSLQT